MLTKAEKLKIAYYRELAEELSRDADSNRSFAEEVYDLLVPPAPGVHPITESLNRQFRIEKYIVAEIEKMAAAANPNKRAEWIERRFSDDPPKDDLAATWQRCILALDDPPPGWQPTPAPVYIPPKSEPSPSSDPKSEPEPPSAPIAVPETSPPEAINVSPAVEKIVYATASPNVSLGGVVVIGIDADFDPGRHCIDFQIEQYGIDAADAVLVENRYDGNSSTRIVTYGQDLDDDGTIQSDEYICLWLTPIGHLEPGTQPWADVVEILASPDSAWLDLVTL